MNPYVYSKSKKSRKGQPVVNSPDPASLAGLAKSIFTSGISTYVAFALVLFGAGSVATMSALAYSEMTQPLAQAVPRHVAYNIESRVLGDSTTAPVQAIIQDSQLEAGAVSGKITAKPLSYDSTLGRWDYTISYTLSDFTGTGTLSVGSYAIAQGITASGSAETGSILKPGKTYFVTLWFNDQSGNQLSAIRYELKTSKSTGSSGVSQGSSSGQQCAMPQIPKTQTSNASSTALSMPSFCIKNDDGTSQCAPISCMPPMRRPMPNFKNEHSSSTPSTTWSTSTPLGQHPGGMMQGQTASGTPPNLPPLPTPRS